MGVASSRSPAMAYADGELWCSTFDDAGNRCWVHSQTGETVYYFVGGKPARRPSNTTTSPYTAQDANQSQPWGSPGPVMLSPGHVHRNPGPVMLSPGHVHRSPGHVHRSPGHAHHNPGPLPPSPGPVHHNPGPVHYNPGPVPGPVHHSPAPVHHSPGPATLAAGYGAPNYPGTTMVPYHQRQPGYGEGVAPAGNPAPTSAGEAVGYSSNKSYVRPRSKSWMWTP